MKVKRFLAILLCLAMLFALVACGAKGNDTPKDNSTPSGNETPSGSDTPKDDTPKDDTPKADDTPVRDSLTVGVALDTGTLDPLGMSGTGSLMEACTCYLEPIVDYKAGMEEVFLLATGIDEVTPTQWTIHIREGVTFSNGNPLTADDVLFTLQLYHDTPARTMNVQSLDLENSKVIDDYTLDLRLTTYNVAQRTMLSQVYIVDKESYDPVDFGVHPVGTGPYVCTEYVVNSHTKFEARDDYWGTKPSIKYIQFKILAEDSQRSNALSTGTVDSVRVPVQDIEYVKTLPNYNVEFNLSGTSTMVLFSTDPSSPMADVEARYAVCHAINGQAIANLIYNGYADLTDYPLSRGMIDYTDEIANLNETYSIGYNVDKAKEYAEKSGLVGKTVRILTNGTQEYSGMAEIIQGNLSDIGVKAEILNYDQATLRSLYRSDGTSYDICLYFAASVTKLAADVLVSYVNFSQIFLAGGWEGFDRFKEIAPSALGDPDPAVRKAALKEITQIIEDAALWYGVCDQRNAYAFNKDLNNVNFWGGGGLRYYEWSWS
ncbi:MAG: ABC transporter substrate-binding protein [Oscillospiraceae bacterium]|nr:ABC transporter substrate-binding protein [Oscillospiraceae bacterium]